MGRLNKNIITRLIVSLMQSSALGRIKQIFVLEIKKVLDSCLDTLNSCFTCLKNLREKK